MKQVKLMQGDNIESLKKLPDNSVDSVVTDPPYGLSFMNKKWDYDVPSVDFWKEVYRVLKPGGHVLSFGGTRTYHRMVVGIEDAGFEIRDQIMWIYGSGFPKSHNIGLNVDKKNGLTQNRGKAFVVAGQSGQKDKDTGGNLVNGGSVSGSYKTDNEWNGWGTALKPANEPICVARKPLSEKTIVDNVIRWGVGGINIDGCRIGTTDFIGRKGNENDLGTGILAQYDNRKTPPTKKIFDTDGHEEGRFPANIIFDEEAAAMLDEQSGISKSTKLNRPLLDITGGSYNNAKGNTDTITERGFNDSGGASRFFYVPKVGKKERNMGLDGFEDKIIEGRDEGQDELNVAYKKRPTPQKNTHPTLKPINLMNYLCRLVTPPGGIVLDPFMGSGSTGISACLEGFRFIGMELDEDYFKIAEARINSYEEYRSLTEIKQKLRNGNTRMASRSETLSNGRSDKSAGMFSGK